MMSLSSEQDAPKRAAAARAVEEVEGGVVVGPAGGSTDAFAVDVLSVHVAKGLRVVGITTSEEDSGFGAAVRRAAYGLCQASPHEIAIDGAIESRDPLNRGKDFGHALLREEFVTSASDRMTVAVDETKLVTCLGGNTPLSAESVSFGWQTVLDRLVAIGGFPTPLDRTSRR